MTADLTSDIDHPIQHILTRTMALSVIKWMDMPPDENIFAPAAIGHAFTAAVATGENGLSMAPYCH
jgi:hypothetical protein